MKNSITYWKNQINQKLSEQPGDFDSITEEQIMAYRKMVNDCGIPDHVALLSFWDDTYLCGIYPEGLMIAIQENGKTRWISMEEKYCCVW